MCFPYFLNLENISSSRFVDNKFIYNRMDLLLSLSHQKIDVALFHTSKSASLSLRRRECDILQAYYKREICSTRSVLIMLLFIQNKSALIWSQLILLAQLNFIGP